MAALLVAALLLGIIAVAVTPSIEAARISSRFASVQAELRILATGIESYYVDNMQYPPSGRPVPLNYLIRDPEDFLSIDYTPGKTANDRCTTSSWSREIVTFRVPDAGQKFSTITTPVAYVVKHYVDPFADDPNSTYGYFNTLNSWVTFSPGPAGWPKRPAGSYALEAELPSHDQLLPLAAWTEFLPGDLACNSFDPTNGMQSRGFILRRKQ